MRLIFMSLALALLIAVHPALAAESFEVGADSTLFSETGSLVRVSDPDVGGATIHCFEFGNLLRIYGMRQFGSDDWQVFQTPVYLCPTIEMLPAVQWKFPDDDFGNPRTAMAVRQESVTVPAGNFPNAWRVEVTRDDQPSVIHEVWWYSANVGPVKRAEYQAGAIVRKLELMSYDVTGFGYFPLVAGNSWQYSDVTVEGGRCSVGSLKDLFRR